MMKTKGMMKRKFKDEKCEHSDEKFSENKWKSQSWSQNVKIDESYKENDEK